MDHLIYPDHPALPPLAVPYLCDGCTEYDCLDFCTYPQRQGWASKDESFGWLACPAEQLCQRAQIWLYFGTLSEFLGEPISPIAFRLPGADGSSARVSTAGLLRLLERKSQRYKKPLVKKVGAQKSPVDKATLVLKEAMRLSELLEQQIIDQEGMGTLALISCSIRVLLQTLGSAKYARRSSNHSPRSTAPITQYRFPFEAGRGWRVVPAKLIRYRMAEVGWCPAQIYFLSQKYSCEALYYISGIPRQTLSVGHRLCSSQECRANNIDERLYKLRHTNECHGCDSIGSLATHIASIIIKGEIPIVSCYYSSPGLPRLEVIPARPNCKYIAISHVWSGGLGNPHDNSIPTCQLRELMRIVECLHSTNSMIGQIGIKAHQQQKALFWIDTLCIPVGNAAWSARKISIAQMTKIYSGAYRVLALDEELRSISLGNISLERALAHILSSSWMFRCWTLQEASIAQSCYVQFADKALALQEGAGSAFFGYTLGSNPSNSVSARSILREELFEFVTQMKEAGWRRPARETMWSFKKQEKYQAHAFAATWNNFLGRSTTKMEDLHRILGAMQDFKAADIRDIAVEDRMKAILKGHAMLPLALLYLAGSRVEDENSLNRWAPAFPQSNKLDCDLGYVKVFTDCLLVVEDEGAPNRKVEAVPSIRKGNRLDRTLRSAQRALDSFFQVKPFQSRLKTVCLITPAGKMRDRFTVDVKSESGNQRLWIEACSLEHVPPLNLSDATSCILFPNLYDVQDRADWYETRGARFWVEKSSESSLHLAYDCPIQIYTYDRTLSIRDRSIDSNFELIPAEPAPRSCRVFIDCDLSAWPSARHFFDSPEGPLYEQATGHIYLLAYISTQLIWPVSFVVVIAAASPLHLRRLPLFCCYVVKVATNILEVFWWRDIWQKTERQAWSEDFGSDDIPAALRYYAILNQNPSILFGTRRGLLMIAIDAVLLATGFSERFGEARWARWAAAMVSTELLLRITMQIGWLKLPETSVGRWLRQELHRWWPRVRDWLMKVREAHVSRELSRRPFQESLDLGEEYSFWG